MVVRLRSLHRQLSERLHLSHPATRAAVGPTARVDSSAIVVPVLPPSHSGNRQHSRLRLADSVGPLPVLSAHDPTSLRTDRILQRPAVGHALHADRARRISGHRQRQLPVVAPQSAGRPGAEFSSTSLLAARAILLLSGAGRGALGGDIYRLRPVHHSGRIDRSRDDRRCAGSLRPRAPASVARVVSMSDDTRLLPANAARRLDLGARLRSTRLADGASSSARIAVESGGDRRRGRHRLVGADHR